MRTLALAALFTGLCAAQKSSTTIDTTGTLTLGPTDTLISTTVPSYYSFNNANGTEYLRITPTKQGTSLQTVEYSLPHSKITLTGAEFEQALIDFARKRERESKKVPSNVP